MTKLIFKNDLEKNKLDALLQFLKTWDIEAELKTYSRKRSKKQDDFSLAIGLWKDHEIESKELRDKA